METFPIYFAFISGGQAGSVRYYVLYIMPKGPVVMGSGRISTDESICSYCDTCGCSRKWPAHFINYGYHVADVLITFQRHFEMSYSTLISLNVDLGLERGPFSNTDHRSIRCYSWIDQYQSTQEKNSNHIRGRILLYIACLNGGELRSKSNWKKTKTYLVNSSN